MKYMGYKIKNCLICGVPFQSTNNRQKWCVECRPQAKRNRQALWQVAHPNYLSGWRSRNPSANALTVAAWCQMHPEARSVTRKKSNAKRRDLGFVPLNQPFDGCEAHHFDRDRIAYIPKELHRSMGHNVWTGHNMEQINALALQWLAQNP